MKIFGSHSSLTSSKLTGIIVSGDVALSSRRKRSEMCRRGSCHKTLKYELKVTEYSCKAKGRISLHKYFVNFVVADREYILAPQTHSFCDLIIAIRRTAMSFLFKLSATNVFCARVSILTRSNTIFNEKTFQNFHVGWTTLIVMPKVRADLLKFLYNFFCMVALYLDTTTILWLIVYHFFPIIDLVKH